MNTPYLFCMATVFLLFELNAIAKRKSQNPIRKRAGYQQSFLGMALLFFLWGFFQALVAKPFFPNWQNTSYILFTFSLYNLFQIKTKVSRGPVFIKIRMPKYMQPILFGAAFISLACCFLQYDPQKPFPIKDQLASTMLLGILFLQMGMMKSALCENGIALGLFLISWKRIVSYQIGTNLALFTNLVLFPYFVLEIEEEQYEEVEHLLLEKAPQAASLAGETIAEPGDIPSQQTGKGTFYDDLG